MEAPSFWARALPLGEPKKLLGLGFIVAVAVIWVGASFVVQGIEEHGAHPAVLTFVANSLFAVYVPVYFANLRWRRRRAAHARNSAGATRHVQETGALVAPGPRSDEGDSLALAAPRGGGLTPEDSGKGASPPASMPLRQLFHAALVVSERRGPHSCARVDWRGCGHLALRTQRPTPRPPQVAPLWYVAQLTFNTSLHMTSVTSNTILSSTSALFTFVFAVTLLHEAFTLVKLGFILLLIVGECWCSRWRRRRQQSAARLLHLQPSGPPPPLATHARARHAHAPQAPPWSRWLTASTARMRGRRGRACWATCCACCPPSSTAPTPCRCGG